MNGNTVAITPSATEILISQHVQIILEVGVQ